MQEVREILLNCNFAFPPGTNNVYGLTNRSGHAQSYMRKSGTGYKADVIATIKEECPDFIIPKRTPLKVQYKFWVIKSYLNKFDLDGHVKVLQDAIFKAGGGNDAWVREMIVTKYVNDLPGHRDWSVAILEVIK